MSTANLLEMFRDTAIKAHIGFKHEGPWEECEWVECEDRKKMIESVTAPVVAPPNHALVQLLESALRHPESAEGNIRQVIEALNTPAPIVALDDSGFIDRAEFLTALSAKMGICIANANDASKSAAYRLMMEHFAEAGRQIIEFVETLPLLEKQPHGVDHKKLSEAIERVLRNWPHSTSGAVRELLKVFAQFAPASTVAPQQSLCLHQCDYGGMPRCSLPAGHEGTHDYTNAPASPAALRDEAETGDQR